MQFGTERRFATVLNTVMYMRPPREVIEVVTMTLSALARKNKLRAEWTFALTGYLAQKGHERELAHLLELDCESGLLETLFRDKARRVVPALAEVAERLRDDPAALKRVKIVDEAMGLKGALVTASSTKKPKLPKAPPRVKFAYTVGTDGGPILVIPKDGAAHWQGVLRDGVVPSDGNFAGTDYQRACDVAGIGFIKVGRHQALVLGNQGCDMVLPKDGGCFLVLSGSDEETVYEALSAKPKWRALKDRFRITGELLFFDAAMEHAKTKNKKSLDLPAGSYTVEQLGDRDHSPWIVRLTRHPR